MPEMSRGEMVRNLDAHSSITITIDRYGHLFPGNEAEAATLLDGYLDRATGTTTSK